MARWYEASHGIVWNYLHPLWPSKTTGEPYTRPPKKVVEALNIKLFPSVTTVSALIAHSDTFSGPANWVQKLAEDVQKEYPGIHPAKFKAELLNRRKKQRDIGSGLHECLEHYWKHGTMPIDSQAQLAVNAALRTLKTVLADDSTYEVEFQMCDSGRGFGGTVDLLAKKGGKPYLVGDYKFSEKHRKPKLSEAGQIAAYMEHYECDGCLVYVPTIDCKPEMFFVKYRSELHKQAYRAFCIAKEMFNVARGLDGMIGREKTKQGKKK